MLGATRKDAYPIIAIAWAYVGFSDFDVAGVVPLPHVRPIARLDPADRDASSRPEEVVAMPGTELGYQRLALRLKVGEVGVVRTASGYHVLVRTE